MSLGSLGFLIVVWAGSGVALALAPLFLLLAALVCGRFPGHRLIQAVAERRTRRRRHRIVRLLRPNRPSAPRMLAHGGTLIATSIAKRPPPAQALD
jgi:hypothetical protein